LTDGEARLVAKKAEAGGNAALGERVLRVGRHPGRNDQHGDDDQHLVEEAAGAGMVPQLVERQPRPHGRRAAPASSMRGGADLGQRCVGGHQLNGGE
jgi:hypothetical protein